LGTSKIPKYLRTSSYSDMVETKRDKKGSNNERSKSGANQRSSSSSSFRSGEPTVEQQQRRSNALKMVNQKLSDNSMVLVNHDAAVPSASTRRSRSTAEYNKEPRREKKSRQGTGAQGQNSGTLRSRSSNNVSESLHRLARIDKKGHQQNLHNSRNILKNGSGGRNHVVSSNARKRFASSSSFEEDEEPNIRSEARDLDSRPIRGLVDTRRIKKPFAAWLEPEKLRVVIGDSGEVQLQFYSHEEVSILGDPKSSPPKLESGVGCETQYSMFFFDS
jgi:hypothetical protein